MAASSGAIRAGRAFVELLTDNNKLVAGLRFAQAKLKAWGASATALGRRLLLQGGFAAAPLVLAGRTFASFSDQMSKVRAVTQANEADFKRLTETAEMLGRTTSYTASQVAAAMVELGRAGFKPDQIDAMIGPMLSLARATDTELAVAAEIAGNVLRGFNMDASQMARVADVLTAAANNSATTVVDLGEGLKYVAPLAAEAGASVEDVSAAMGVLANNGIKGTLAGNALARAYKNLSMKAAQDELAKLGVQAVDARGDIRPLATILAELGQQTRKMGSARKLAIFESLFGRGQAAALKLARPEARFDDLLATLEQAGGVAKRTADQMDDNLGGSFRMLASAAEGVQIAVGRAMEGVVRNAFGAITRLLGGLSEWISRNRGVVITIVAVVAAVLTAGAAMIGLGLTLKVAAAAFGIVAIAVKVVVAALTVLKVSIAILASPIGLVVAAVVGLGVAFLHVTGMLGKLLNWLGGCFDTLKEDAFTAFGAIGDFLTSGNIAGAAEVLWTLLKLEWARGTGWISVTWTKAMNFLVKVFTEAWGGLRIVFYTVVNAISTGWDWAITGMAQGFTWLMGKLKVGWENAKSGAANAWTWIRNKVGNISDEQADAQYRATNEANTRAVAEIENAAAAEMAERERGRQARQAERDREYTDTVGNIVREQQAREAALDAEVEAKEQAAQAEVDAAKKRLAELAEQAKKERAESERKDRTPEDIAAELKKVAGSATAPGGLADVLNASKASSRGIFNAEAILSLQAQGPLDRIAKACEDTARNTKKMTEKEYHDRFGDDAPYHGY